MSVEDAHREHLLTEAINRLKSDNAIVGFNHGTCESMEMDSQEIKEAQESFIDDPADSEYQRGYLIAMVMGAAGGASGYTNGGYATKVTI